MRSCTQDVGPQMSDWSRDRSPTNLQPWLTTSLCLANYFSHGVITSARDLRARESTDIYILSVSLAVAQTYPRVEYVCSCPSSPTKKRATVRFTIPTCAKNHDERFVIANHSEIAVLHVFGFSFRATNTPCTLPEARWCKFRVIATAENHRSYDRERKSRGVLVRDFIAYRGKFAKNVGSFNLIF